MSLYTRIRDFGKVFAWSFLGFIIGGMSIYLALFYEKHPRVTLEIMSNAPVLDIHEKISNLDILYAGDNIKDKAENIRIMTVRIINDGNGDILKSLYDENDPLGFQVNGGIIAETPQILDRSSEYLGRNVKLVFKDNSVRFPSVILERDQFFVVKVLILHREDVLPDIYPLGKIATSEIRVTRPYKDKNERGLLQGIFGGGVVLQICRVVAYPLILIITVIVIIIPIIMVSSWHDMRGRRKTIRTFKAITASVPASADSIFDSYLSDGPGPIFAAARLLNRDKKLLSDLKRIRIAKGRFDEGMVMTNNYMGHKAYIPDFGALYLRDWGVAVLDGDEVKIDAELQRVLKELARFLSSLNRRSLVSEDVSDRGE